VIDFADPPLESGTGASVWRVLKTRRREVVTLSIGPLIARETIWHNPSTGQRSGSAQLRRLVAPGCTYGYDVVEEAGRKLFVEAQSVRQIIQLLKQSQVFLNASTVADLGRRFIVLLALAHRRCTHRLRQAIALQGGYILHLDATYEDKSPMLMTGFDAVMEIVLGNVKLPSEKAEGIVPFLRRLQECFGPPRALVHDMSKGILSAVAEVFPGIPDFICHFHFLRDAGKDLLGADYDRLRQRLQTHGTLGRLRARLRVWRREIRADPPLQQVLDQLPTAGWPAAFLQQAPLLAAYLLAHWIVAGREQGCGYGFPFDRPLLVLAQRAQETYAQLQLLLDENPSGDWRRWLPLHHLAGELKSLVHDYPLKHNLSRLESHGTVFDQLRQALRIAPFNGEEGLNDQGEELEMKVLERQVQAFAAQVRARADYATTPVLQKMIEQIEHYGPKLFADPLIVSTPQGPRTIQPQRTNNLLERFFRNLKRDCRHRTGCHSLGRSFRSMLPDTPLVKNLQNSEYMKILLDGQPSLAALFAQIDPANVREELVKARQPPEHVPRALKRFIADLPNPNPIKNFIKSASANRLSSS
jgi:hypothetical protein